MKNHATNKIIAIRQLTAGNMLAIMGTVFKPTWTISGRKYHICVLKKKGF